MCSLCKRKGEQSQNYFNYEKTVHMQTYNFNIMLPHKGALSRLRDV